LGVLSEIDVAATFKEKLGVERARSRSSVLHSRIRPPGRSHRPRVSPSTALPPHYHIPIGYRAEAERYPQVTQVRVGPGTAPRTQSDVRSMLIVTPSTGSLVISSDGQNTSVSPQRSGRAEYATPSAFAPIRHNVGVVGLVRHDHTEIARQRLECDGVRDVPPLLEEGIAERETSSLANLEVVR